MALNTFGFMDSNTVADPAGNAKAGKVLTVWEDMARTVQVTALFAIDGVTPLAGGQVVSAAPYGRYGFKASDAYSMLYMWDGVPGNDPWPIPAHEALDAGTATHAAAVAAAEAAKAQAQAAQVAAENAAALVDAPADDVMAAALGNPASQSRTVLSSTLAARSAGVDITTVGAVADELTATVSITTGTNILTRSSGAWTAADVGKVLSVPGAQATPDALGRNNMPAKITGFTNATTVTLDRTAAATVTGATVKYATDNAAVLQAALDAANAGLMPKTFIVPATPVPFWTNMVLPHSNTIIRGPGTIKQIPRNWNDSGTSTSNGGTIMPWHGGRGSSALTENVVVEYLRIDGNKGSHYGSITNRTNGEGINFKYGRNCLAFSNVIWDTNGDGIDFDDCENSRAMSNHITNASGCGIHSSNNNVGNTIVDNTVINCGWDQYTDSGVTCGGIDGSGANGNREITYIGNTVDGCRINYAIGDPATMATDKFVGAGNRSRAVAATPALPDILNVYSGSVPGTPFTVPEAFNVKGAATFDGNFAVNNTVQTFLASSNSSAFTSRQTGDAQARFTARASGVMFWGDGTSAQDVSLGRTAADLLALAAGDSFKMDGTWNGGRLILTDDHVWLDANGLLRVKINSAPTSDTDGNVIGGGTASGTTANLVLASNSRNTVGKYEGRQIWNSTLKRPVWATGSAATDTWVFADGTVAHTPA